MSDAREERKRGFNNRFEAHYRYGRMEDLSIKVCHRQRSETAEAMADTASSAV